MIVRPVGNYMYIDGETRGLMLIVGLPREAHRDGMMSITYLIVAVDTYTGLVTAGTYSNREFFVYNDPTDHRKNAGARQPLLRDRRREFDSQGIPWARRTN